MTPCGNKPQWGGDLFTTNCEEGRHAWRADWDKPDWWAWPRRCKWCDVIRSIPRYRCPILGCEVAEYVHVEFGGVDYDGELGVLVDVYGNPTNRWEDGVAGVPEDVKGWIEMDDAAPICPEHDQHTEWESRQ